MSLELNIEQLNELTQLVSARKDEEILNLLNDFYPADIAIYINRLTTEDAKYVFSILPEETAAPVLTELEEDVREKLLASFSSKEIAEQLDNLDSDDAADIIEELPETLQDEVLSHLEDVEQASDIADLLSYEPDTAGGLMAKELVSVYGTETVAHCVETIREQADDLSVMYAVYVVDSNERLVGILSLKTLIISKPEILVNDIFDDEVISVKTNTPSDEVADIMQKYDLVVLPVVDSLGRLVGRITIDDVVDVMREEGTEDVQKMGGMEALEDSYMSSSLWQIVKKRVGWLIILFIGEGFTATAMSFFENEIAKATLLALFVPLIISSGGNTGSQASSLIIRALALGQITVTDWWLIMKKELRVGIILGIVLGIVGFIRVALYATFSNTFGPHWQILGLAIGLSLLGVVLWGNLVGSLFPILLKKLNLDPAVASAPFVATLVDITGLLLYFTITTSLLTGIIM